MRAASRGKCFDVDPGIRKLATCALRALLLLPLTVTASRANPVVLWGSDPVRPGQTALLFGDSWDGCSSVRLERLRDADLPLKGSPRSLLATSVDIRMVKPLQVRPRSVKFLIPPDWAPGVFRVTVETPGGRTETLLNRPQILWAQGDRGSLVSAGGFVRVVGKCLAVTGHAPLLRLTGHGSVLDIKPSRSEPFTIGGPVPKSVQPGHYDLQVHSGCGGASGWSSPRDIQVVAARPAPRAVVEAEQMGVRGDGDDDTAALQKAAVAAADRGGGTVLLPRGRFVLSDMVTLPHGVTLKGAGMALTALCWSDTDNPPEALIRGSGGFGVQDLTLYATNYRHGIVADQVGPDAGHVRILRVRMRLDPFRGHLTTEEVNKRFVEAQKLSTGGGDSLRLGGEDIEVAGCDIYGAGRCLYLSRASGAWIHDNLFYNGRWGWYCISGSSGVIFERNSITGGDLMSTGGGLNCLDGSMISQNVYYAENTLRNMFGWDREAMTTDAGGGAYYGQIASVKGSVVTLADAPDWGNRDWTGAGVFILDGKGQGQYRQIVRTDGSMVTVDAPFVVAPDNTSIVTVTMIQRNYLFVNNRFEDAGVAVQMYGTSIGAIAAGNVSARTGGFHNFGMNYDGVQPSWFIQWIGNRIEEGNVYGGGHDQTTSVGEAHLGVFALPPGKTPEACVTLCCVVRDNVLENNAHLAVGGSDPPNSALTFPYVQEVVVEGNRVENADVGLIIARASAGVLARNNTFVHCLMGMVDEVAIEQRAAAKRAKLYAEPGPLLHLTFDAPDGKAFPDVTGHGFDARSRGKCIVSPDGVKGGCLTLDGSSYLVVAHPSLIKMENLTLSAWVRTDHIGGRWGILSKRISGSAAPFILTLMNGAVAFEATDVNGKWTFNFQSAPLITPNAWHHLAAVVENGKGAALYLDGVEVAHKENALARVQTDEPLVIGREAWGGDPPSGQHPCLFTGSIDDVQVWAQALSPSEIAVLAKR